MVRIIHYFRIFRLGFYFLSGLLLGGSEAFAHGFGVRHRLEVPLYYYVLGAGLTVALSFVIATFFVTGRRVGAGKNWVFGGGFYEYFLNFFAPFLRFLSVFSFFLIIFSGFLGLQSPTQNLAPVLIWSIWWVGMVYVQGLVGDVWRLVNPWANIFAVVEQVPGVGRYIGRLRWPEWVSCWPAVMAFWFFAWLEQVAPFSERPRVLVELVLAYSLVIWVGMFLFGREVWLRRGEAFSILFGYLARMAPTRVRDGRLELRPLGVGLLVDAPLDRAATALILILLATVTFDGFRDTSYWQAMMEGLLAVPWLFRPLFVLQRSGIDLVLVFQTAGLVVTPVIFFLSYHLISYVSAQLAGSAMPARRVAGSFVLTLVPICFAYHIAHYLVFLLLAGQLAIPLFSDPFHMGWNLFGTLGRQMNVGIIGIETTWWVAIGAVVTGHVYAVYLAHVTALRLVGGNARAMLSQVPLILLMICYTMMSLWILAQPIVVSE